MAMNAFEKFRTQVGDIFALNTKIIGADVKREVRKIKFDGQGVVNVTAIKTYVSENIDVSRYSRIEIYVQNKIQSRGYPTELMFRGGFGVAEGSTIENLIYYDWNDEKWTPNFQGFGSIKLTSDSGLQLISTHPNGYWLRDLMTDHIELRFLPPAETQLELDGNTFEAWIVGELNV